MQVHFICLQWKHFNNNKFESMCFDPSISWNFEAGRMASVRQGKHLPSILHIFYLIVFFQEAHRKEPMPLTFLACFFSCTENPQVKTSFLCPFHSCLVPWDWFPLVVNIHSPHLKPKAAGASHLSGQGQRQGAQPACQLLEKGQNSCSFASTSVQKRCFLALPALQTAGRPWGIAHITCTFPLS